MSRGSIDYAGVEVAVPETFNGITRSLIVAMGGDGSAADFTNIPGHTGTWNAANFSDAGDADEVKITVAVAYVAALGGGSVWIPRAMQGYNPTAVPFHPLVKMVAEGYAWPWSVTTPEAFGAPLTGDCRPAFQAMCDWISSQGTGVSGGSVHVVRLANRSYSVSKPVWSKAQIVLLGDGTGFDSLAAASPSLLAATFAGGPILAVQSAAAAVTGLTTALVTGTGFGWSATDNNRHLLLRESARLLDVNGLSQFCVETFYKGTGNGGNGTFVTSSGRLVTPDTLTSAFFLGIFIHGARSTIHLSTTGTVTLSGGVIDDNAVHHVAMSYDGSTVRLFVDGVAVSSSAGSGSVVQGCAEDVSVGVQVSVIPAQTQNFGNPNGVLDSLRISKTARYTADFTAPTAKLSSDTNTLALLNFDEQIGAFTKMRNADGTCWAWERDIRSAAASYGVPGTRVQGVTFKSSGQATAIWFAAKGQYEWSVEDFMGVDLRVGVYALDGYNNYVRRFFLNGGGSNYGRYGLVFGSLAGVNTISDIWTQGVAIHGIGCGEHMISRHFVQMGPLTHVGWALYNLTSVSTPSILDRVTFNPESGLTSGVYRANLVFGNAVSIGGISARNCDFSSSSAVGALAYIEGVSVIRSSFRDCLFFPNGATPASVMAAKGVFINPVIFDNCHQLTTVVDWSDTAGTAALADYTVTT